MRMQRLMTMLVVALTAALALTVPTSGSASRPALASAPSAYTVAQVAVTHLIPHMYTAAQFGRKDYHIPRIPSKSKPVVRPTPRALPAIPHKLVVKRVTPKLIMRKAAPKIVVKRITPKVVAQKKVTSRVIAKKAAPRATVQAASSGRSLGVQQITMYCATGNQTSSGKWPTIGMVAVLDRSIPFGTVVNIQGLGRYVVEDWIGHGSQWDIYGGAGNCETTASNFGRQHRTVTILSN